MALRSLAGAIVALTVGFACAAQTTEPADPAPDSTPHKISFITTTDGVRLEVLDYGGQGTPVLLISGYGQTGTSSTDLRSDSPPATGSSP